MTDIFAPVADATPIQPDDQKKLIPTWIHSRDDLNVAEEDNIASGYAWAKRRKPKPLTTATDAFSRSLHKVMFGKVWKWAGEYRQVELEGIGVPRWQIAGRSAELFDQFRYWIEHKTFPPDEIAVRFHHGLVFVHAFTNGNGRQVSRVRFGCRCTKRKSPLHRDKGFLGQARQLRAEGSRVGLSCLAKAGGRADDLQPFAAHVVVGG